MSSRFIHVVACVRISFPFKGWIIFHCIYVPHLLYPFIHQWMCALLPPHGYCEQWCCEHGFANICLRSSFTSFRHMSRSGIPVSCNNSVFNFLRNVILFSVAATPFYSLYKQWMRVSISLHPHWHLLFSVFLIVAILVGMKQYLIMVKQCSFITLYFILWSIYRLVLIQTNGLPRWLSGKGPTCQRRSCRDAGWIPGSGRSPAAGDGNPPQYSCL